VEGASADEERRAASRGYVPQGLRGVADEVEEGVADARLHDVDHMVAQRLGASFREFGQVLAAADVQPLEDLSGVGADYLPVEGARQAHGQRRLSAGGRPEQRHGLAFSISVHSDNMRPDMEIFTRPR
jgi:hypothetical protein